MDPEPKSLQLCRPVQVSWTQITLKSNSMHTYLIPHHHRHFRFILDRSTTLLWCKCSLRAMASDGESSIEEVPLTQALRPPASWIETRWADWQRISKAWNWPDVHEDISLLQSKAFNLQAMLHGSSSASATPARRTTSSVPPSAVRASSVTSPTASSLTSPSNAPLPAVTG